MKKIIMILIAFMMLFPQQIKANAYSDVNDDTQINLVAGLDIMIGYEDDSSRPDELVNRADFATIITRLYDMDELPFSEEMPFLDIDVEHWAYDAIGNMYKMGFVNGYTDYQFKPNNTISYIEAIRILVDISGYKPYAIQVGGYPNGYLATAQKLKIAIGLENDKPITRKNLANMIANTLKVEYLAQTAFSENGEYKTEKNKTVLSEVMKIKKETGIITGCKNLRIDGTDIVISNNDVLIDDKKYLNSTNDNFYDFVGFRVDYYIKDIEGTDEFEVVYIDILKNSLITIHSNDIKSQTSLDKIVFEEDDKTKNIALSNNMIAVYNGKILEQYTKDDFIPNDGDIVLIENNSDNKYDIIFIKDKKTFIADRFDFINEKIYDKYTNEVLILDNSIEEQIHFGNDGNITGSPLFNSTEGNVIEAYISKNNKSITTFVTSNIVIGNISETNLGEDEIKINDKIYKLSNYFKALNLNLEVGENAKFYLNRENEIVAFEKVKSDIYEYGYLVDAIAPTGISQNAELEILSTDSKRQVYLTQDKFSIKGMLNYSDNQITAKAFIDNIKNQTDNKKIIDQLIMYKLSKDGLVSGIILALDNTDRVAKPERFDKDNFTKDFVALDSGIRFWNYTTTNYYLDDNSIVFFIPIDLSDEKTFKAGNKKLLIGDLRNVKLELYDTDEAGAARVAVRKVSSSGETPTAELWKEELFIFSHTTKAIDEKGDTCFKVYGYKGSKLISFISKELDEDCFGGNNYWDTKYGDNTELNQNKDAEGNLMKEDDKRYNNYKLKDLKKGDVILLSYDINSDINGFLLLLAQNNKPLVYTEVLADGGVASQTAHLAAMHTAYGMISKRYSKALLINTFGSGDDNNWNKTFTTSGLKVYIYDSQKKDIMIASQGDINEGDKILLKTMYNVPKEIVVLR